MSEEIGVPLKGNWDTDFPRESQNSGGENRGGGSGERRQILYMDLKNAGEYRIRLAGPYVSFKKYWEPIRAITHEDYGDKDPLKKAGFFAPTRFAINIIDRADGKLKVLEAGSQVFKSFGNCARANKIDPAGKEGPDFTITVTIPRGDNGKPNPRRKTYAVQPTIKSIPFTSEEVAMIKEQKLYPLSKIYKAASLEKIIEMWNKVPADQKIPKKKDGSNEPSHEEESTATASEAVENVAIGEGGDMFAEESPTAKSEDLF